MNRKYIKIIFLSILVTQLIAGCTKDWLDKKPSQDIAIPATLRDFQALMDNGAIINQTNAAGSEVAVDERYVTDAVISTAQDFEQNAYTWSHRLAYISVLDWISPYARVLYCNTVLDGLKSYSIRSADEQQTYNDIKGQALFNRARLFYDLSQQFCPPYTQASANTPYGINLRLESDINIPVIRSTVQQTYDQIISDLIQADGLLPNIPLYKTRASRPAVFALLARVSLVMLKYEDARRYADSCLNLYGSLMNFNSLTTSSAFPIPLFNSEVIFHCEGAAYTTILKNNNLFPTSFYNSYDANDLRKAAYFDATVLTAIKFKGGYAGKQQPFTGIATDEVILIRAECKARAGDTDAAMADLNLLLSQRWRTNTFVSFNASSSEEALKIILRERKKELIMRNIRWSDLRRLSLDLANAVTATRVVNGVTYTLEPGSHRYTFPIPDDIIQQTNIAQNPGW